MAAAQQPPGMDPSDAAIDGVLDEIRERNEQSIAKLKLGGPFLLGRSAYGDVRRLLAALDEVLGEHLTSVTADGEEICPTCGWVAGKRVPVSECLIRRAISGGLSGDSAACPAMRLQHEPRR